MKKPRKKNVVAVLAGVAVAAAIASSAATLGGLQTDNLGANSNVVESPIEGGVAVSWTTGFNSAIDGVGGYAVDSVHLATVDSDEEFPAGSRIEVTLIDINGSAITAGVIGSLGTEGNSVTLTPAATVAAADVYGVSVVVNGGEVTALNASID